jgi:hypothetical protein
MPFRSWGIDLIGQIYPSSSKGHKFILAATDYFTKWVEAVPLKTSTSKDIIAFIKEHTVYRFGIPRTITTDQGTMFTSDEFKNFAAGLGIKLLNSTPYYSQANKQAKASNKNLIKLIKRKVDEYPRKWHDFFSEALQAYQMPCHGATKISPYQLVYDHEAILPCELKTCSRQLALQNQLTADDYKNLMIDEYEELVGCRLRALENNEANKKKVARAHDKKVKPKGFQEENLVWKLILPIGMKDVRFGKWLPNWEGPYQIKQCLPGNAYIIEILEGEVLPKAFNGKYLKKYFPSVWVSA